MTTHDVILHVENDQDCFIPGSIVRGRVEVLGDEAFDCKGLTVGLRWKTRSKGPPISRTAVSELLFEGRWQPQTAERHFFALALPAGPFSYNGQHLQVVWELFAEAKVSWGRDPAAVREIVLKDSPNAPPDWEQAAGEIQHLPPELQTQPPDPPKKLSKAKGLGCLSLVVAAVLMLLIFVGGKLLDYRSGEISGNEAIGWFSLAVVILTFVGGGLIKVLRDVATWSRTGQVQVNVTPRRVRAGDRLRVGIACTPRKDIELRFARLRLQAQETVIKESTEHRRAWRAVVFEQEIEIAKARHLSKQVPFGLEEEVMVPTGSPPSFATWGNRIEWDLIVQIEFEGWPDFEAAHPIQVHP